MCADCQRRADTNPLRVLDCKVPADQPIIEKLPKIIDHLDPECRAHFDRVRSELEARSLTYTSSRGWYVDLITTREPRLKSRVARWARRTRSSAAGATMAWSKCWADRRRPESASPSARTV